jgi:hypothetical protein
VGGVVLALGATALGAWYGSRVRPEDDPKNAELTRTFANAYLQETRSALAGTDAVKELPKPVAAGRSKKAVEAAAAQAVYQACQVAATNLPAAIALDLSGKAAQAMFDDQALKKLDDFMLTALPAAADKSSFDAELAQVRYADTGDMGPAVAAISTVVIDREFAKDKDAVTMDFVVGHELSHIRHKDAVSKLGHLAFSSLINLLAQQESDPIKKFTIATMLVAMGARQSRDMELRADREGVDYALSKGHDPQAVEKATRELFSAAEAKEQAEQAAPAELHTNATATAGAPENGLFDTHPPNPERILEVQRHLEKMR